MNNNIATRLAVLLVASAAFSAGVTAQTNPGQKPNSMKMERAMTMASTNFKGIEVNGGHVNYRMEKGRLVLTLSDDFSIPKTPAPHWQVVDSKGNVYLLSQLRIAGDKTNRSVVVPSYIKDVAKVQIWCSFAEVNLGEAMFAKAVMTK
jgi:hypothetical protein